MFGKKMSNYEQNETQILKIYLFSFLVIAYFFLNLKKSLFSGKIKCKAYQKYINQTILIDLLIE